MATIQGPTLDQIHDAIQTLSQAMQFDSNLAWAWHCNIAIMVQDAGVSHKVSNDGAARFMRLAFHVDTSKAPIPEKNNDEVD